MGRKKKKTLVDLPCCDESLLKPKPVGHKLTRNVYRKSSTTKENLIFSCDRFFEVCSCQEAGLSMRYPLPARRWHWRAFSEPCSQLSLLRGPLGFSLCVVLCVDLTAWTLDWKLQSGWPIDASIFRYALKASICSFSFNGAIYVEQSCATLCEHTGQFK